MALSADGSTLYVAQDNQDQVAVISTSSNTVTAKVDTRGPASLGLPAKTTGASPTNVTINPVTNTLYAVNAGSNSIAVIPLSGAGALTTTGLIPTAYDPTDIAFSADGSWMYNGSRSGFYAFPKNPDLWRFNEWNREFQQFVANGNLPTLSAASVENCVEDGPLPTTLIRC